MYRNFFKPLIDFLASLIALVILLPILVIIIILLYLTGHKSVFFTQTRVGKNEKTFKVLKFKTMTDGKDKEGNLLSDAERLTPFGLFLRKSSLDELPQLVNVLKGDMSLIGPRPLLIPYIPLYSKEQKTRHNVKPGITGWAQVNGRNAISWTRKFELDVWYVNHLTLATDFKIVLFTIKKVFAGSDISQEGQATAEAFNGHN